MIDKSRNRRYFDNNKAFIFDGYDDSIASIILSKKKTIDTPTIFNMNHYIKGN